MQVGERIGEYEILGKIRDGGMGTILRARHRLMKRTVAIKIIHPQLLGDPGMIKRFRREIEASARLAHANVLTAFDAGFANGRPYLVTEYLPGDDLETRVRRDGALSATPALRYVRQAACGLQAIHLAGIVHRDVKPANVMLDPSDVARVIDFGISKLVDQQEAPLAAPEPEASGGGSGSAGSEGSGEPRSTTGPLEAAFVAEVLETEALHTLVGARPVPGERAEPGPGAAPMDPLDERTQVVLGTPLYAAPEQVQHGDDVDVRSDVYALGATLFFVLTGEGIVPGRSVSEVLDAKRRGATRRLADVRDDMPPGLDGVLERMTALRREDRFASMDHVVASLEHASVEPRIFISYRREDSLDATDRLYTHLKDSFDPASIFLDVDTIPAGADFREQIRRSVGECDVMLVVIGDHWLRPGAPDGSRRIDDPADLVRLEIESAIEQRIPLIPVLVGRTKMPAARELPGGIEELAYRQAAEVRAGTGYAACVDQLRRSILEAWRTPRETAGAAPR